MKSSKIVYTKVSNKNSKNLNNIITNGQIVYKLYYKMYKIYTCQRLTAIIYVLCLKR